MSWIHLPISTARTLSLGGFLALGFVLGGSILTEVVFGYPGLGTLLYHSVTSLDYLS